jgi:hypothetical protein
MDNLAQIHLELANQGVQEVSEVEIQTSNLGASWDAAGWDEIFKDEAR